jgi:hypothetical protein
MEILGQSAQPVDVLVTAVTYLSNHSLTDCYSEFVTTCNSNFWLHKEPLKAMINRIQHSGGMYLNLNTIYLGEKKYVST